MSARRVSLSDLADQQDPVVTSRARVPDEPGESSAQQDKATQPLVESATVAPPTPLRPHRQKKPAAPQPEAARMRYDEYERKETRLRDDQYGRLTTASRRLNKLRKGSGERITENTLIRVAIDLLLNEENKLAGASEAELRKSVGL